MNLKLCAILALLTLALPLPSNAHAAPFTDLYTAGHADMRIEYDAGFDFFLRVEGGTVNGVPNTDVDLAYDSTLILTDAQFTPTIPFFIADYSPVGIDEGESAWWLPQTNGAAFANNVPFLGLNSAASGVFVDDDVTLSLVSVASPSGNGVYSFWQDAFPLSFNMASSDGIDGNDSFIVPLGHDHFNMGFIDPSDPNDPDGLAAAEGLWTITYGVSGDLVGGGTVSDTFSVNYWVGTIPVPEPSVVLLVGIALGAFFVVCRRTNRTRTMARAE